MTTSDDVKIFGKAPPRPISRSIDLKDPELTGMREVTSLKLLTLGWLILG